MSKKAKIPVIVPKGVKVNLESSKISMEGPKGKINMAIPFGIRIEHKEDNLMVYRDNDLKQTRASHGSIRAHIANMITGVTVGHKKDLEIQGIGFRAQAQGKKISFVLGFSHPVEFVLPDDVEVKMIEQTGISLEGVDIQRVGQMAAKIRALKPVEPYKGKGVRYVGEVVRRKQGKSVTK